MRDATDIDRLSIDPKRLLAAMAEHFGFTVEPVDEAEKQAIANSLD